MKYPIVFTGIIISLLTSCTPLGYMQSPRVLPGYELGTQGSIGSETKIANCRYDSTEYSSTGFWPIYSQWGINDRIRVSLGVSGLSGMVTSTFALSGDLMVNIVDLGKPQLFKNIAVGGLLSGTMSNTDGGTANPSIEKRGTGGVLVGTAQKLPHGGKLELVTGTGITYRKLEIGDGGANQWTDYYTANGVEDTNWFVDRNGYTNTVSYSLDVFNPIK